ncbi:MAG: S9 family peptidase, partial [Firmicutes bacterium]|nr:S9 family peptidase [Candidatus Fermentithermobacillaceae bacterium]
MKSSEVRIPPPPHTPVKPVIDVVHGVTIEDPYRWLENGDSPETQEWTDAQNKRTEEVLGQISSREFFVDELTRIFSEDYVGSSVIRKNRLFYIKRVAGQNQPVLCMRELSGSSPERVILDPNKASDRGIVALDWWYPSQDGTKLAYGYSERGDEWSVLRILDIESGETLPDEIERARGAGVTWEPDGRGFYYNRYPKPGDVPPGEENYNRHLYYHRLGQNPQEDRKIYGEGRPKEEMYGTSLSDDGKYLLLTVAHGWNSTDILVREAKDIDGPFTPVVQGIDALFHGRIYKGTLYMMTNYKASRYRIVAVSLDQTAESSWRDIVPEDPEITLTGFSIAGDSLVITGMKDASSRIFVCNLDGSGKKEIPLPTLGTVGSVSGQPESPEVFFAFQSFAQANAIYRFYVDGSGKAELVLRSAETLDPSLISVKQVFYSSKDGTRVPMFIIHRKDLLEGDGAKGPHPTVLTGYGGFNLARVPAYAGAVLPWIMAGGIYASANLRGGNEYGEEWHRAGMRENKQNVFDDFVAAAEYLIREGYTDKEHLGIWGRSNGGLLVGAAMTQRPDLFKAVSCGVPLLDMVRYHKFLIAYIWAAEYGDPDNPQAFRWLYAYSPYHRVREDVEYPAVLFYTALSDSRVDPMHARKMAARLQAAQLKSGRDNPVLLVVESDAGPGVGNPLYK